MRRPRKRATKASLLPTPVGGAGCQSTESMLAYHSGAWEGSPAYAATSATGRAITVSTCTSTPMAHLLVLVPQDPAIIPHEIESLPPRRSRRADVVSEDASRTAPRQLHVERWLLHLRRRPRPHGADRGGRRVHQALRHGPRLADRHGRAQGARDARGLHGPRLPRRGHREGAAAR